MESVYKKGKQKIQFNFNTGGKIIEIKTSVPRDIVLVEEYKFGDKSKVTKYLAENYSFIFANLIEKPLDNSARI